MPYAGLELAFAGWKCERHCAQVRLGASFEVNRESWAEPQEGPALGHWRKEGGSLSGDGYFPSGSGKEKHLKLGEIIHHLQNLKYLGLNPNMLCA